MKKAVVFILTTILVTGGIAFAENLKIGYVDLGRALNESESGKKAKTDLEFVIKSKQSVLDEKGKAIEKAKSDLEKQSSVLSSDARKSKEDDLERMLREFQRLASDSQADVKKKEQELTNEIIKEIRVIIEKISQEEGYTLVLEGGEAQILFAKKEIDLTETVIRRYNESKTKEKK